MLITVFACGVAGGPVDQGSGGATQLLPPGAAADQADPGVEDVLVWAQTQHGQGAEIQNCPTHLLTPSLALSLEARPDSWESGVFSERFVSRTSPSGILKGHAAEMAFPL